MEEEAPEDSGKGKQETLVRKHPENLNRKKKVGNYLLGRIIGEGSFAKVRQGLHIIAREKVAVKIVTKKAVLLRDMVKRSVRREAVILQRLDHPNIVRLYEIMETENSYYLVQELAENGDFIKYLSKKKMLEEDECRKYIRQMASALDHMHTSNITHRDLKLENLLLDKDQNIKIIDFGSSNVFCGETSLSTQCGSPVYAAPEMFIDRKYGPAVDIWTMGVCMFAMLTGKLPFRPEPSNNLTILQALICRGPVIPDILSDGCSNLLSSMMDTDVQNRIKIDEILAHVWLSDGHETPLITKQPPMGKLYPQVPKATVVNYMTTVFNFMEDEIFYSVIERKMNAVAATYHLLQKRFEAGLHLLGSSMNSNLSKGDNSSQLKNGENGHKWNFELPTLPNDKKEVRQTESATTKSTYKSYLQLLKDSKLRSAQSVRTSHSFTRQKELTVRRQKTRADIASNIKAREETGFLPDFILTYNQNENFLDKKYGKFEWEQTFIISKKEPVRQDSSFDNTRSKTNLTEGKDLYTTGKQMLAPRKSDNEIVFEPEFPLYAPPTTPATPAMKFRLAGGGGSEFDDEKVDMLDADSETKSVGFDCNDKLSSVFQKQQTQLPRGVVLEQKRSRNLAYSYGIPLAKSKTLYRRDISSYFSDIEHAQVLGHGRKLVDRSRTSASKFDEVHNMWTRKTRTASSQRSLPVLPTSAAAPVAGRPSTQELGFRTIGPNNLVLFPDVQQKQVYDIRPTTPSKETVVDGVTDVIKVQITGSNKF